MHFVGPDQLHGFEERLTTDVYPGDFGWTPDWSRPGERVDWWYHNMSSVKEAGVADMTNALEYDDEVAFHAVRRLYDYARYEEDAPLALCVSFTPPARPVRRAAALLGSVRGRPRSTCRPPPALPPERARSAQPPAMGRLCDRRGRDHGGRRPPARHGYYASLSYVDERIGEMLDRARCLRPGGRHGRDLHRPTTATSSASTGCSSRCRSASTPSRVPLSSMRPARFAPRRVQRAGVARRSRCRRSRTSRDPGSLEELAQPVDGRSLVPLLEGAAESPDAVVVGEYLGRERPRADGHGPARPLEAHPRRRATRISSSTSRADPLELVNLAGRLRARSVRRRAPRGGVAALGPRGDRARRPREPAARLAVFRALQLGAQLSRGTSSRPAPRPSSTRGTRWTSRPATGSRATRRSRRREGGGLSGLRRSARDRGASARPARGGGGAGASGGVRDLPQRHPLRGRCLGRDLPAVYGHEAAGVVEEVGPA